MSHFTVLVVGEDWEQQLDPFWELDLSKEELKNDYRAKFRLEISNDELEEKFNEFLKKYPEDKDKYSDSNDWVIEYHGFLYNEKEQGYGYYGNPDAKWDWYSMGGRWRGFFKLKNKNNGVIGRSGVFDNKPTHDADQALKGDIDFEGMRDSAIKKNLEFYNKFYKIANGRPVPVWKEILEKYGKENISKEDLDKARDEYHENPVVKDLLKEHFWDFEDYLVDRETFIKRSRDGAILSYAVVKDGVWYERGQMGWWGMASNEKDIDEWNKEFSKLIESLPDDTLLTLVDCHI